MIDKRRGLQRTAAASSERFFWRYGKISREAMINEEIRAKELRVIDTDGSQLGIMSRQEALDISEERKLDLVCVSPKANPPVCKILDYGKYKYELQKRKRKPRKSRRPRRSKKSGCRRS